MNGLFRNLSPIAPDYSGACSALFDLHGLIVVCDAGGCTLTYTGKDEPRWYRNSSECYSYGLRELDVALGQEDDFIQRVVEMAMASDRKFIALVGTPVPAIAGMDLVGIACSISSRVDIPVFACGTTGFRDYSSGVSESFMALARHFCDASEGTVARSVNILGATPLDMGSNRHLDKLVRLLQREGYTVTCSWTMGATLDGIRRSAGAKLNLVISQTGLDLATELRERFGTPFVMGLPIGRGPTRAFIEKLKSAHFADGGSEGFFARGMCSGEAHRSRRGLRALVIGEPVMCRSVGFSLALDFGIERCAVASVCAPRQETQLFDELVESEEGLARMMNRGDFELVVGDPQYEGLLDGSKPIAFLPLPHSALSGPCYWDARYEYVAEDGYNYLKRKLSYGFGFLH
jgi:nitrogenase molybdenum-cofactor synthesis protein NifE